MLPGNLSAVMHIQNRKDAARWQVARKDEKRLNRVEATAELAQLRLAQLASPLVPTVAALPAAEIFVFDNNSTDDTRSVAGAAGAVVFLETHRGKGFVVRRMFSDVEADVYVLVDGDATYDASSVRLMVRRLLKNESEHAAYRAGHRTGNKLLSAFVAFVFRVHDQRRAFGCFHDTS
jgi:cellulose synthase/poly-beta-1,6-N-acetylglucosamine synthase-like glycosyltransferase